MRRYLKTEKHKIYLFKMLLQYIFQMLANYSLMELQGAGVRL